MRSRAPISPWSGDWVCVSAESDAGPAIIHSRLDRRGTVARKAAGRTTDEQVIAANVDTIFVVTAPAEDLSPRRIERYLTMIWEAGAAPVVVLNKADLTEDPGSAVAAIRARISLDDVVALSALTAEGMTALDRYLAPTTTIALLGSSGVGKSTIVNRLLGRELQKVAPIRTSDGTGRHTTTTRQLIELPGGALLIDTPGMRELQPWADESAVVHVFDDIAATRPRLPVFRLFASGGTRMRGQGGDGGRPIGSRTIGSLSSSPPRGGVRGTQARQGRCGSGKESLEADHAGPASAISGTRP